MQWTHKTRIFLAAAMLTLTVLPVSCGNNTRNNTTDGMNENGIYDGSHTGENVLDRAGDVIDDAGDAIGYGADRVVSGLDRAGDDMTADTTRSTVDGTTRTTEPTTTTTTRSAVSSR